MGGNSLVGCCTPIVSHSALGKITVLVHQPLTTEQLSSGAQHHCQAVACHSSQSQHEENKILCQALAPLQASPRWTVWVPAQVSWTPALTARSARAQRTEAESWGTGGGGSRRNVAATGAASVGRQAAVIPAQGESRRHQIYWCRRKPAASCSGGRQSWPRAVWLCHWQEAQQHCCLPDSRCLCRMQGGYCSCC